MKPIIIAKYKRCSTNHQELELQDDVLNKAIGRLREDNPDNVYEVLEFVDYAISGKNTNRGDLQKMLGLVDKKKIDIIICTKLDRLARSLQDLLNMVCTFKEKGAQFIVAEQNLDTTTPQGRLLFQIIGAFSEFERVLIRERLEAGRRKAEIVGTKSGKPCHRPRVEIDEGGVKYKFYEQKKSMTQIAKDYNVSITPIRRILNEHKEKDPEYIQLKKEQDEIKVKLSQLDGN